MHCSQKFCASQTPAICFDPPKLADVKLRIGTHSNRVDKQRRTDVISICGGGGGFGKALGV